ncbi:MAG: D-aminoacylase [Gammaproteobacteria bacterium]|nr:D-aminoacylase [Gammaproteobacteria bacterium]
MQYDVVFRQAMVIDGTGAAGKVQDVAVNGDQIVALGQLPAACGLIEIAAEGLVLAPGFIDVHTHDDLELIRRPQMIAKISQGVTTVITGNCGISAAPALLAEPPPDPLNLLGTQQDFSYPSFADYRAAIEQAGPAVNVASLVGHTTLRNNVLADLKQAATPAQALQMQQQLRQSLAEGAIGLSSGLAYHNAFAADADELAIVGAALTEFDAIYTTHLRTEFDGIIPALAEAADLGLALDVPVVISHLKCAGLRNWGRSAEVLQFIGQRAATQPLSCDCYPYSASSSTLDLKQVTSDFDIFITWSEPHPQMAGQTLAQIASQWQLSLLQAAERLMPAGAVYHGMAEADVQNILQYPKTMIGSDGLPCDPHPHPRLWGAFPRVLGHYSRELKLFSLAAAVHKMTGLSAQNFRLAKRGQIKPGYFADLVLFDPQQIIDSASFVKPIQPAAGILQVYVNGVLSYQQGQQQGQQQWQSTGQRGGRFLAHRTTLATTDKSNF